MLTGDWVAGQVTIHYTSGDLDVSRTIDEIAALGRALAITDPQVAVMTALTIAAGMGDVADWVATWEDGDASRLAVISADLAGAYADLTGTGEA